MNLYYIKLKGYKYLVKSDFFYNVGIKKFDVSTQYLELNESGLLRVKTGYTWNGASGPTFDTKSSMRGSLLHDCLYQMIRLKKIPPSYREHADKLLETVCLEDGMWKIRAHCWEKAVRWFAWMCAKPGSEKPEEILCAPED